MSDIGALVDLSARFLRRPVRWGSDPASLVFDPPLTSAEAATFAQLQAVVAYGLTHVDPALLVRIWPQIEACAVVANLGPSDADYATDVAFLALGPADPDYALAGAFLANATPTPADAFAAISALIRITARSVSAQQALIRINARTIAAQQALIEIVRLMFVAGARA